MATHRIVIDISQVVFSAFALFLLTFGGLTPQLVAAEPRVFVVSTSIDDCKKPTADQNCRPGVSVTAAPLEKSIALVLIILHYVDSRGDEHTIHNYAEPFGGENGEARVAFAAFSNSGRVRVTGVDVMTLTPASIQQLGPSGTEPGPPPNK